MEMLQRNSYGVDDIFTLSIALLSRFVDDN